MLCVTPCFLRLLTHKFRCHTDPTYWIHLPISRPWENGCAVPNHSYHICHVELSLKGVCKNPPRQVSTMPCWWDQQGRNDCPWLPDTCPVKATPGVAPYFISVLIPSLFVLRLLCEVDYVGYTARHLYEYLIEHKNAAIGKRHLDASRILCHLNEKQIRMATKCYVFFFSFLWKSAIYASTHRLIPSLWSSLFENS